MKPEDKCDACPKSATVLTHCTWWLYELRGQPRDEPMQQARLCPDCLEALWRKVKPAVNSGLMHWTNVLCKTTVTP